LGYGKGLSDQQKTLTLIRGIFSRATEAECLSLRQLLKNAWLHSDGKNTPIRGYLVNMTVLTMRSLLEFDSPREVTKAVFHRLADSILSNDSSRQDTLGQELLPQFQSSLTSCQDRFDTTALEEIKAQITWCRNLSPMLTGSVEFALNGLEHTVEHIEFERFARTISAGPTAINVGNPSATQNNPNGFSPKVTNALKEAGQFLRTEGEFDPKIAGDLIRSAIDEAHREVVASLEALHDQRCSATDKDGSRRAYMREVGFITQPEEEFFSAIYSLLSQEASHKLITARETILLLYQTVSGYLSLLSERLSRLKGPFLPDLQ